MQDKDTVSTALDSFLDFMNTNGLNTTAQRRAIAQAFFAYPGHHTLEEFYQHVQTMDKSIGQTTVYRTLKLLSDAGLAREIQFTDGVTRYEFATAGSHHDHIMCVKCGKIVEICDMRIENLQKEVAEENDFTLLGHYHVLYGLCRACREKEAASQQTDASAVNGIKK